MCDSNMASGLIWMAREVFMMVDQLIEEFSTIFISQNTWQSKSWSHEHSGRANNVQLKVYKFRTVLLETSDKLGNL